MGIFNASIFNNAIFNTGAPAAAPAVVVQTGGGRLSWKDFVTAEYRRKHLKDEIAEKTKELKKVSAKIKTAEKKAKKEKNEGILANLMNLEFKRDEIKNEIRLIEIEMIPLELFLEAAIDEDDEEMLLFQ